MALLIIDIERCKACSICVAACPLDLLSLSEETLNQKGYHPVEIKEQERCTACAICARMCPDTAIRVEK